MNFRRISIYGALGMLGAMLFWVVLHSMQNPLFGDSIYLHYGAYLIGEQGFVPYRDLFEINFPLTYFIHALIGKTFGFGEFALRVVGFLSLSGLLALVYWLFRPISRTVGWFVVLSFGLVYLSKANYFFQRDFLVLIPSVFIIQTTLKHAHRNESGQRLWLALGLWTALVALIKPHYVAILPVALLSVTVFFKSPLLLRKLPRALTLMALGFSMPVILMWVGLWYLDGWEAFVELVMEYLPLYAEFKKETQPMSPFKQVGDLSMIFLGAVNLLAFWERNEQTKAWLKTFSLFFLLGNLIGSVQGYAGYYFLFAQLMFLSLLGISMTMRLEVIRRGLPAKAFRLLPCGLALLCFVKLYFVPIYMPNTMRAHQRIVNNDLARKEFIVDYFEHRTTGKETIQPYHWGWPITAALLDLERPIATKYICVLQFHHTENYPYIEDQIDEFVQIIETDLPDYFVVYLKNVKWQVLPEIQEILNNCYEVDAEKMGVRIFKKKACPHEE